MGIDDRIGCEEVYPEDFSGFCVICGEDHGDNPVKASECEFLHDGEPGDIDDDFGYDPYSGGPEMDDPIDPYECDYGFDF